MRVGLGSTKEARGHLQGDSRQEKFPCCMVREPGWHDINRDESYQPLDRFQQEVSDGGEGLIVWKVGEVGSLCNGPYP